MVAQVQALALIATLCIGTLRTQAGEIDFSNCEDADYPGHELNSGYTMELRGDRQHESVRRKLEDLGRRDQEVRRGVLQGRLPNGEALAAADRPLERELRTLIAEHGLYRLSEVGGKAVQAEFLIIDHSNDSAWKSQMLVMLKNLEAKREISSDYVAVLEDRIRIETGRPQLYGTQTRQDFSFYEIEDPQTLDVRRAQMGLPPLRLQECAYDAIRKKIKANG
jgi:hypothetical protein